LNCSAIQQAQVETDYDVEEGIRKHEVILILPLTLTLSLGERELTLEPGRNLGGSRQPPDA